MLSLYLHIPFCAQVCSYCSFPIAAKQGEDIIQRYLQQLHAEIDHYGTLYPQADIKSIYFGGGTPNLIGAEELIKLITHLEQVFNCEQVAELSLEFNPYPQDEILSLVKKLNTVYRKRPRVRYSFGIQSFDNGVLAQAGRPYTFPGMVEFLRALQPLKQENNVFNFDFIAFGKFNQTKKGNPQLRTPSALSFFEDVVHAHFADSFSLYTLEFSEHQARRRQQPKDEASGRAKKSDLISKGCCGTEEEIYEEFDILKNILLSAGYKRYEISNFALISKSSIHNRVYREMEEYLWLGMGASSFLHTTSLRGANNESDEAIQKNEHENGLPRLRTLASSGSQWQYGIRHTNTPYLPKYLAGQRRDKSSSQELTDQDYLIEKFFLGLRTDRGVRKISDFSAILVDDRQGKIKKYAEQDFLCGNDEGVVLTDKGMDCYNAIVTELLKEI